jgi:hypothetical protein
LILACLAAVAAAMGAGCFSTVVDGGAFVDCGTSDECPAAYRCVPGLGQQGRGRCFAVDRTLPTAPVALAVEVTTSEDTAVDVPLAGSDADGDALRFAVLVPDELPGTLGPVEGGVVRFTPARDHAGTVTLSFIAIDDDGLESAPATAVVRVLPVDDPPRIVPPRRPTTREDTPLAVNVDLFDRAAGDRDADTLQVIDVDSNDLVVEFARPRSCRPLVCVTDQLIDAEPDGDFVYTPPPDFVGEDSIVLTVRTNLAGVAQSATLKLAIEVTPENDAPTIAAAPLVTAEDTVASLPLTVGDIDDDVATLTIAVEDATSPSVRAVGAFAVVDAPDGPTLRFTPTPDFAGGAVIALTVHDPHGAMGRVQVPVVVTPVADVPVALPQLLTIVEDTPTPIVLEGVTVDGGALTFLITRDPARGTLVYDQATGTGTYQPPLDGTEPDSFAFVVRDAAGLTSDAVEVPIAFVPVDDPPVAASADFTISEDAPRADFPLSVVDVEGDPFTLTIVSPGILGDAVVVDGRTLSYQPRPDAHGEDEVVVRAVGAGHDAAPTATIRFSILSVPDLPRAVAGAAAGDEDSEIAVELRGENPDGVGELTFRLLDGPTNGTLRFATGSDRLAIYDPDADFHGTDEFLFAAVLDDVVGQPARFLVEVLPVNDAPVVVPDVNPVLVARGSSALSAPVRIDDPEDGRPTLALSSDPPDIGTAEIVGDRVRLVLAENSRPFAGLIHVGVVAIDADGASSSEAFVPFRVVVDDSCAALRNSGVTESGVYTIAGVDAYCDMATAGGGWTLVAKVVQQWGYGDRRWDEPVPPPRDAHLAPFPDVDARLDAWNVLPPVAEFLLETWDADGETGRQTLVLALPRVQQGVLADLFGAKDAVATSATATVWAAAFSPGRPVPGSVLCTLQGIHATTPSRERCRLCALGGSILQRGDCSGAVQAYGLGIDVPLALNSGAEGLTRMNRRTALWVREDDFSKNFPSARSCTEHGEAGRVMPGRYDVSGATVDCAPAQ